MSKSIESEIYKGLRTYNDAKAVSKGASAVSKRIQRRVWGRFFSKLIRELVK